MSKIVFAGVGKTDREIIEALDAGIGCFNIESEAELENLIKLAKLMGKRLNLHCVLIQISVMMHTSILPLVLRRPSLVLILNEP